MLINLLQKIGDFFMNQAVINFVNVYNISEHFVFLYSLAISKIKCDI